MKWCQTWAITFAKVGSRYFGSKLLGLIHPSYRDSVSVITNVTASGYASTIAAFIAVEAGINIENLTGIILLLVISTTLWAIIGTAVIARKLPNDESRKE